MTSAGVIETYGHGGDLLTAAQRFGREPGQFLDYSANINPLGMPASVREMLLASLAAVAHYPDPGHRVFRRALARRLQVPEEWLLPANGAAEAMALAILGLSPQTVGVVYPCFSEYAQLSEQYGARVIGCFGKEANGYKPDPAELYTLFTQCDLVFVGSPNNPTGILYQPDELRQMAEWTKETNTWLIVDEAFLDFVEEERQYTLATQLEHFPRVILMRSMTKMYAIPGLRLGYAIAHPDVIAKMRQKQVSWSVNALALLAGELCLQEQGYEGQTRRLIKVERAYLTDSIRSELGWQVWPSEANFLLLRSPEGLSAEQLQARLGKKGVLIRNCAMYPGLTAHDVRIAVRGREENERLMEALREAHAEGSEQR
ncbi:threonine-phosphate decarboxylase CobD [Brevibacillus sp. MER 51]|uniref:threonine-phosphate decarboxylase CobD n=1 Tax=Brevibacillus sp. MER 51 TaxID=2939560 RepID=UPI00203C4FF1|nr:threonine-phosphate decarboxylase CobD [Brevibacillus sp. MER 51]MCM3145869.1 threonine-phosphate decarboxylase CobD [Brevibacillus sp. MER 51]